MKVYKENSAVSDFLAFYRGDWREIFSILLYGLSVGIFSLVVPLAAQSLVNTISFATLVQPLIVLTIAVTFFLFLSSLSKLMQFFISEKLAQRLIVRVALDLSQSISRVRYDLFKRNFGSEYINRFLEIVTVQKATSSLLLEGSAVLFQLVFGIVLLGFYHPFFLIFAIVISVSLLFIILVLGKHAIPTSINESDKKYDVLAWLEDISAAPAFFKSEYGQRVAVARADQLLGEYVKARKGHFRVLLTQHVMVLLIQILSSTVLLGAGGVLVMKNQLSLGQLVAAELILTVIISSTDKLTKFLETFYDLVAGIVKLNLLISLPQDISDSNDRLPQLHQGCKVQFEDVNYEYTNNYSLLDGMSLAVQPGEKILIYGGNGSGKSIIADLIVGYKHPHKGKVLIDDIPLDDIDCNAFRSQVSLVRGVEIVHGTIESNVRIARDDISTREIREVLGDLGLLNDIDSLSDGMKTYLKGDYSPLSLGQAERLMVARALLQKSRLIIFDASFDVIDEGMLQQTITVIHKRAPMTTVIATSRERDSIDFFDTVYAIQNKKLIRIK